MPEGPSPTGSDPPVEEGSENEETANEQNDEGNKKSNENAASVFPVTAPDELRPLSPFPYSENEDVTLPEDYRPTKYDVINGRGRKSYNHIANRRFRQLTAMNLRRYQSARCKVDKTLIVIGIVNSIRKSSPCGGFIKKCTKTGRWISMSDEAAREKVGHCLRDMIASQRMDNLYGKATKALASQSKQLQQQEQEKEQQQKLQDKMMYSMPTKLEALHGNTVKSEAIRGSTGSPGRRRSPNALLPVTSKDLTKGGKYAKKDKSPKANNPDWKKVDKTDYAITSSPDPLPTRTPDPPTHHLPGPIMANSGEMLSQVPSSFTNFDIQGKGNSQDMSWQQRQILQMLESGFKGTVEELIEACKPTPS